MKNRNKFEVLTVVLFIAVSIMCGNGLHAQSLKKTFKYIKEGEIAKADIEVQEFKSDQKTSVEDLMLYGLASCLIICNENYQNYDPYKSLELFKTTAEANANKAEVDEFLGKYELSITKVQEIIYQSIFSQAQKINTEKTYEKALSVCQCGIIQSPKTNTASSFKKAVIVYQYCFYKDEAIKLKEEAAYNESKKKGSVEGCKYFIGAYPKSEHVTEINNLLYGLAFQNAKANMTLESMNDYLKEYANISNSHMPIAIHLRDSIAFSKVNKSYDEYVEFASQYPKSEYYNKVIQELPDLLYNKAISENNIQSFELFIENYPANKKVEAAKKQLEELYYQKLKANLNMVGFEKFKNRFPKSVHLAEVSELLENLSSNSDLKKYGLLGQVKSIETFLYSKPNFEQAKSILKEEYNSKGYITYLEGYNENFIVYTDWNDYIKDFADTKILQIPNKQNCIIPIFNLLYSNAYTQSIYKFEYNDDGLLSVLIGIANAGHPIKCAYEYDANRNLKSADIYEKDGNYPDEYYLAYKIKYNWSNGFLISRQTYNGDGSRFQFIDYEYRLNIISAKVFDYKGIGGLSEISVEYDQNKLPIKRILKTSERKLYNQYSLTGQWTSDFIYSQSKLSDVSERGIYKYNDKDIDKTSKYHIDRDSKGMIKSLYEDNKQPNYFSEYKYDSYGNWVEITTCQITRNDIDVKSKVKVIKRKITYYD